MKFFGFNSKKEEDSLRLSSEEKEWVEDNFVWLMDVFGYPSSKYNQLLFTKENFPATFSNNTIEAKFLLQDICDYSGIPIDKVSIHFISDLRNTEMVPFETDEPAFESELNVEDGKYTILIAKKMQDHPGRLVHLMVYQCVKIQLIENNLDFATGADTEQFIFLASIFLDFGLLLSTNLRDIGKIEDGTWETHWSYVAPIREEVLAYSLALYVHMAGQLHAEWIGFLAPGFRKLFDAALINLQKHPSELVDPEERRAADLIEDASEATDSGAFHQAFTLFSEALPLTKNTGTREKVLNNLGSLCHRLKRFEDAIPYFNSVLELFPEDQFALDHLSLAHIKLRHMDEARVLLERSSALGGHPNTMLYFSFYFWVLGDVENAHRYFKRIFEFDEARDGYFELVMGDLLIQDGFRDEGLAYYWKSHELGYSEATQELRKLKLLPNE